MKKYIFILLIICFITLTIFNVNANSMIFPLLDKTIVLDAGHGGVDNGSTSGNVKEKDINLKIVLKLKEVLENNGATIILTRTDDNDLSNAHATFRKKSDFDARIKIINESSADMYLSIHQNYYYDSKYYGPQVFYEKGNEDLATSIQKRLNEIAKTGRNIKRINNKYMYNKLYIKGVLIECGFLSNKEEKNKLITDNYQDLIVKSILEGIIDYFNK